MTKGVSELIDVGTIKSKWYADLLSDWKPDENYIEFIIGKIKKNEYVAPVIVVKEEHGFFIVNGHHRCYAWLKLGKQQIKCIVIEGTFAESEPLRKAELLLKEFDERTEYRYQFSGYLDRWAAAAEGQDFVNTYRPSLGFILYKFLRKIKNKLMR